MAAKAGEASGGDSSESRVVEPEGSQNEFDRVFNETMNEESGDSGDGEDHEEGSDGTAGGDGDGNDGGKESKDAGTGKKPPEDKDDDEAGSGDGKPAKAADGTGGAGGEVSELTAADKDFLKSVGINDPDVTPKELARIRKVHGDLDRSLQAERKRAAFFGDSAKKVSEKYQAMKKAVKELRGQQTPEDRLTGVISKLDLGKLSPEVRELLTDPAYLKSQAILFNALGVKLPEEVPGLEEEDPSLEMPEASGASADAGTGKVQTEAEAIAEIDRNIQTVKTALKTDHPDIEEIYTSKEFQDWLRPQSRFEINKIFSSDPQAHSEVLTRFKEYRSVKATEAEEQRKNNKANDDLRTHQASKRPGMGSGKKNGADDPNSLPDDEEFDKMSKSIAARRVSTG